MSAFSYICTSLPNSQVWVLQAIFFALMEPIEHCPPNLPLHVSERKCVSAAQRNTNFPAFFLCFDANHAPNTICFLVSSKSYVSSSRMKIEIPKHLNYVNYWMIIIFQDKVWNQVYHHFLKILNCESTFFCSNQGWVIYF